MPHPAAPQTRKADALFLHSPGLPLPPARGPSRTEEPGFDRKARPSGSASPFQAFSCCSGTSIPSPPPARTHLGSLHLNRARGEGQEDSNTPFPARSERQKISNTVPKAICQQTLRAGVPETKRGNSWVRARGMSAPHPQDGLAQQENCSGTRL